MPSVRIGHERAARRRVVGALGRDDRLLAAGAELLRVAREVLGRRVGDDRGDGRADARQDADPDPDQRRAQHVPAVHDVVAERHEHAAHRRLDGAGVGLDVEGVGHHLADGEHAEDHGQAVEAALERGEAEGQPHDARALVDARDRRPACRAAPPRDP